MSKSKKSILSLALCLVMMMAMFAMPVYAAGDNEFDDCLDCAGHEAVSLDAFTLTEEECSGGPWQIIDTSATKITRVCSHITLEKDSDS
jgi:hypothetical protein